jgi:hypothetical protein
LGPPVATARQLAKKIIAFYDYAVYTSSDILWGVKMTDLDQAAGNVSGICRLDDFPMSPVRRLVPGRIALWLYRFAQ